jgi:hypothetical protein
MSKRIRHSFHRATRIANQNRKEWFQIGIIIAFF